MWGGAKVIEASNEVPLDSIDDLPCIKDSSNGTQVSKFTRSDKGKKDRSTMMKVLLTIELVVSNAAFVTAEERCVPEDFIHHSRGEELLTGVDDSQNAFTSSCKCFDTLGPRSSRAFKLLLKLSDSTGIDVVMVISVQMEMVYRRADISFVEQSVSCPNNITLMVVVIELIGGSVKYGYVRCMLLDFIFANWWASNLHKRVEGVREGGVNAGGNAVVVVGVDDVGGLVACVLELARKQTLRCHAPKVFGSENMDYGRTYHSKYSAGQSPFINSLSKRSSLAIF
ncbi:hypothetical protein BV22DRAFT_1052755, partial [Leucogyrophana mollusca]